MLTTLLGRTLTFTGSLDAICESGANPVFPKGLSRVSTTHPLAVAYVLGNVTHHMFVLDPGVHTVKYPGNYNVIITSDKLCKWSVRWPSRFDKANPTRVAAALIRPKSQREEMADYVNEMVARAIGGKTQEQLRSGQAEVDISEEDWREETEDDYDSPLSIYQMELIMNSMANDIKAARAAKAKQDSGTPPPDKPDLNKIQTPAPAGTIPSEPPAGSV